MKYFQVEIYESYRNLRDVLYSVETRAEATALMNAVNALRMEKNRIESGGTSSQRTASVREIKIPDLLSPNQVDKVLNEISEEIERHTQQVTFDVEGAEVVSDRKYWQEAYGFEPIDGLVRIKSKDWPEMPGDSWYDDTLARSHGGWKVRTVAEDYNHVFVFEAVHPQLGIVRGNAGRNAEASSKKAFYDFLSYYPFDADMQDV